MPQPLSFMRASRSSWAGSRRSREADHGCGRGEIKTFSWEHTAARIKRVAAPTSFGSDEVMWRTGSQGAAISGTVSSKQIGSPRTQRWKPGHEAGYFNCELRRCEKWYRSSLWLPFSTHPPVTSSCEKERDSWNGLPSLQALLCIKYGQKPMCVIFGCNFAEQVGEADCNQQNPAYLRHG